MGRRAGSARELALATVEHVAEEVDALVGRDLDTIVIDSSTARPP